MTRRETSFLSAAETAARQRQNGRSDFLKDGRKHKGDWDGVGGS